MVKIHIIILGGLKFRVDFNRLRNWKSKIFFIDEIFKIEHLPDSESDYGWEYEDEQLNRLVRRDASADINVILMNAELEDNYYMRRLNQNTCAISLYEIGDIVTQNKYSLEHFILYEIYFLSVLFKREGGNVPNSQSFVPTHQDIRGCLFDFNADKEDIIYSIGNTIICQECRIRLGRNPLPTDFVKKVEKELKKIKKPRFYRISDFIKKYPIWSLLISAVFGIIINLSSSIIYDWVTKEDVQFQQNMSKQENENLPKEPN